MTKPNEGRRRPRKPPHPSKESVSRAEASSTHRKAARVLTLVPPDLRDKVNRAHLILSIFCDESHEQEVRASAKGHCVQFVRDELLQADVEDRTTNLWKLMFDVATAPGLKFRDEAREAIVSKWNFNFREMPLPLDEVQTWNEPNPVPSLGTHDPSHAKLAYQTELGCFERRVAVGGWDEQSAEEAQLTLARTILLGVCDEGDLDGVRDAARKGCCKFVLTQNATCVRPLDALGEIRDIVLRASLPTEVDGYLRKRWNALLPRMRLQRQLAADVLEKYSVYVGHGHLMDGEGEERDGLDTVEL
ncbi:hypothetical protein C8R43DRAFT_1000882 [Mycena crocata]|nr:hypothetical protein C8R43DRAFT_1000882 [Mycena crocata]